MKYAITSERERVISSQKDGEIFFHAFINPKVSSGELFNAINEFKALFT